MRGSLCSLAAVTLLTLCPSTAAAQPGAEVGLPIDAVELPPAPAVRFGTAVQAGPPTDPLWDGIALGAVIGAGTSLGLTAIQFARCDEGCDAPEPGPFYAISAGMGAAAGAVVGWLIDRARKPTSGTVVSIAPVISRPRKGIAVRVAF